jgi:electron transfer flavoprotein alpha subunit/transcriptional regulator with XRE-family HTH domain
VHSTRFETKNQGKNRIGMNGTGHKEIWVWADLRNDRLFGFSLNVLAKALALAEDVSGTTAAVLLGSAHQDKELEDLRTQGHISLEAAADRCIAHGADKVCVLDNPALAVPRADVYALALEKAVTSQVPMLVLFALTDFGRELAARTARMHNAGLIADCADLRIEKNGIVADCPAWGGEIMAEISFFGNHPTGFATVQHFVCKAEETDGGGAVEKVTVDGLEVPDSLNFIASLPEPAEHRKLEDAPIVVVGGAGLGNSEGFRSVRELAATLGGEIGATRPPVLQHWVDEERLIGQTGKTVRPRLLLSIGTSGAVQYTAGIMEAETIVAINRDAKASIFQVADWGIVADWKHIVPLLVQKTKQVVMRSLADTLSGEEGPTARESFGEKVRELRKANKWSREVLASNTGQSPDFIAQIEEDAIAPPVGFLLKLAKTLKVDPGTFLRAEEKALIRDQRAQQFTKRTESYSYETLTPDAENAHLRAFLIAIEPRQAHKPVAYKHEGEEFIFVMEGHLELTLGTKAHQLKPRESIRFNSDTPHKLKNLSDAITRCLVVLYTP